VNPFRSSTVVAALLAIGTPLAAHAQAHTLTNRPAFSLSAGAFQYDLSGTGTSAMFAPRIELPLSRVFLAEGGATVARPEQQFGATTTYLIAELQLQAQAPLAAGRVAPYLGLGGGIAQDRRPSQYGGLQSTYTASAATGVRYWLTDRVGLRGELRVRGIGTTFGGSSAEWTLGVARRF